MNFKNIHIIGTSHIAKESLAEIRHAYENLKPGVVGVELDRQRLAALFSKQEQKLSFRDIRSVGLKGFIFAVVGRFVQHKLGSVVGVQPGSEMKLAVQLAREHKAKVALIDQEISITLRRLSQTITWKEKFRFLVDILKSVFFKKRTMKELGLESTRIDLSKVPEKKLVRNLIQHLKNRYPNVYNVLVEERNHVMAKNIVKLMHNFSDIPILIVVGAGHEEEMLALIKKKYNAIDVIK